MNLTQTVLRTIRQHTLIPPHATLLVAVSGGADSLALLHILYTLRDTLNCHLHVATLDHGWRGAESAADAEFVRETATVWGLPITVGHIQLDPNTPGAETQARDARYRFLAETARQVGAKEVAIAHHADDQAETVLMHLIRGGGISGMRGMRYAAPMHTAPDLTVIRPLLDVTRAQIEGYCAEHDLRYRHDRTNDEPFTLRNILRLRTMPHLSELNPQIVMALNRLSRIAANEDDYLEQELLRLTGEYLIRSIGRLTLSSSVFRALHSALQHRFIAWAAAEFKPLVTVGYDHLAAAADLMQTASVGAVAQLPGNLQVRMGYDKIHIEAVGTPEEYDGLLLPANTELVVSVPGETVTPEGWILSVKTVEESLRPSSTLMLPTDAVVTLRTRRASDRLAGHTRKLKEWLIDRKVPQGVRDRLPLLVVQNKVVAVLLENGWYIVEKFSVDEELVITDIVCTVVAVAKRQE